MLQRLAAIVMLCMMLFGIGGYSVVFKLEQMSIRERVHHRLMQGTPNHQLHHFTAEQLSDVRWDREDREFELDGVMYDVVRTLDSNGTTHFYCFKDGDETRLVKALGDQDVNKHSKAANRLIKFFFSLDFYPAASCQMGYTAFLSNNKVLFASRSYGSVCLSETNPPPWKIS